MAGLSIDVRISDTDLFKDILKLLDELAENDPTVRDRLNEICLKYK